MSTVAELRKVCRVLNSEAGRQDYGTDMPLVSFELVLVEMNCVVVTNIDASITRQVVWR